MRYSKSKLLLTMLGFAGLLIIPGVILAEATGTISGRVIDAYCHEPIPFAAVGLIKDGEIVSRTFTSDEGKYEIGDITPGEYSVEFSMTGYETTLIANVGVTGGETVVRDVKLDTGCDSRNREPITITVEPDLITEDPSTGTTFTGREINRMPVRDVDDFLRALPGIF